MGCFLSLCVSEEKSQLSGKNKIHFAHVTYKFSCGSVIKCKFLLGAVLKKRSQEVEQLISCLDDVTSQVSRDVTNLNEALESSANQSENRIEALLQKFNENRVCIYNFHMQATVFLKPVRYFVWLVARTNRTQTLFVPLDWL